KGDANPFCVALVFTFAYSLTHCLLTLLRDWNVRFQNRAQPQTSDYLGFCLVHRAQALSNSTPQLCARDRRSVAQSAELGPGGLMTVSRDCRAIREKIETEPKIRKWFQDLSRLST